MPVYRAETKFSTKKAGYSALSCVTATQKIAYTALDFYTIPEAV